MTTKFTHWRRRSYERRHPRVDHAERLLNSTPNYSAQSNGRWAYSWSQFNLRRRWTDTDQRPAHDALVDRIRAHRDELKALRK